MTRSMELFIVWHGAKCFVPQADAGRTAVATEIETPTARSSHAWDERAQFAAGDGGKFQVLFSVLESGRLCAWRKEATSRLCAQRGRPGSKSAAEDALGARE